MLTQPRFTDDSTLLLGRIAQSLYQAGQSGGGGLPPQTGTNAQKLGGAWVVPQEFHVTDGFVVSAAGTPEVNGFYAPVADFSGHSQWKNVGSDIWCVYLGGDGYGFEDAADGGGNRLYTNGPGNTDPFSGDWESFFGNGAEPPPTLAHPAVQTLTALPASDEANWSIVP